MARPSRPWGHGRLAHAKRLNSEKLHRAFARAGRHVHPWAGCPCHITKCLFCGSAAPTPTLPRVMLRHDSRERETFVYGFPPLSRFARARTRASGEGLGEGANERGKWMCITECFDNFDSSINFYRYSSGRPRPRSSRLYE